METTLNYQRQKFCKEYVVDYNGTQAAIRAGYSERSAYSQATRLLKNDEVQKLINELEEERRKQSTDITAEMVLNEIKEIATDPSTRKGDRIKALELLAKYLKLFDNKTLNVNITKNLEDVI